MSFKHQGPFAQWGRKGIALGLLAWLGLWLHDHYPGLYVLMLAVGVCTVVVLWARAIARMPKAGDVLAEHHQRELERTTDDSALLMELRDMFRARACDWPDLRRDFDALAARTPCPACGHYLMFHEPNTKVCDVCHAPGG